MKLQSMTPDVNVLLYGEQPPKGISPRVTRSETLGLSELTPIERRGHVYRIGTRKKQVQQLARPELPLQFMKPDRMVTKAKEAST